MGLFAKKAAQASLEYLLTYGWALVLISTIAAVLAFVLLSTGGETSFSSPLAIA